MFSSSFRKILSVTIAVAAAGCLSMPQKLAAASPDKGAKVTFTAQGTFSSTPVSGNDTLKLAGQPFTITIVGSSAAKPFKHGRNWATFLKLSMTGTVYSGLIPGEAIPISSNMAEIQQTVGASEDIFVCNFPVTVVGIALNAEAHITLPGGTMVNALLRPFPSIALDPSNATVTYSNTTAATTLSVDNGTISATVPSGN